MRRGKNRSSTDRLASSVELVEGNRRRREVEKNFWRVSVVVVVVVEWRNREEGERTQGGL